MLLNPGSYMRIGENSEFELADNSLENLEVRLIRGTAILEVTGADDSELLISIITPQTRMAIVRRGLYRVNVVPGDTTELIVRKGRVMLEGSHTKIKGGNRVVFSSNSFSVAKLDKTDKKGQDTLEGWSKIRAQSLAKANSRISGRELYGLLASLRNNSSFFNSWGHSGIWVYDSRFSCYTFLPFFGGWSSPYGGGWYGTSFYPGSAGGGIRNDRPIIQNPSGPVVGNSSGPIGSNPTPPIERTPTPPMSGHQRDLPSDERPNRRNPPLR
jgi:hypothetical protein